MIKLKELRKNKQLTQEELISQFNIRYGRKYTAAAISQFENGKRIPETQALMDFADFFNVSVDYLLGRTDEPQGTGFQKGLLGDSNDLAEKVGSQAAPTTSSDLTPDEIIHIKKYRALSDKGKQIIDMNLDQLKEIINNSKKE